MVLIMIVFWLLVVAACIAVWRAMDRGARRDAGQRSSEELLDERFARGEIGEDEYRRRRELLRSGR
jgi:putative membrane protein